jgi:hypothetical protein
LDSLERSSAEFFWVDLDIWKQTYLNNAKAMVQSPEFLKDIEPEHSSKDIVNRMYAVFLGRCASDSEMRDHLADLKGEGPPRIVSDIVAKARDTNPTKIFEGGFRPTSCPGIQ